MNIKETIKDLALEYHEDLISIRRHLHTHPELSFQEVKTAQYIESVLKKIPIPYTKGWAGHGIVALLQGEKSNAENVIALRADMDALPIQEENDVEYKSQNHGIMHACGHDVHSTCLIGALMILNRIKDHLPGVVKGIFQPGEEKLPGGASIMIEEGVLLDPSPRLILGQHVHPPLASGKVGVKGGSYMASADEIYITIKGRGGHGALPHQCIDPIVVASTVILSVQQIISRNSDPTIPSVLTFGKINSIGGATNIIPDEVCLEGTFRTMDEEWRAKAHQLIIHQIESIVTGMGASCDINLAIGYPALHNHEILTSRIRKHMESYLGDENVEDLPIRMTAEDFAWYSQKLPSCFYRLGTGNLSKNIISPVHTPTFDIDENALMTGAGLMAYLTWSELSSPI